VYLWHAARTDDVVRAMLVLKTQAEQLLGKCAGQPACQPPRALVVAAVSLLLPLLLVAAGSQRQQTELVRWLAPCSPPSQD
jgi:hypothetical protein